MQPKIRSIHSFRLAFAYEDSSSARRCFSAKSAGPFAHGGSSTSSMGLPFCRLPRGSDSFALRNLTARPFTKNSGMSSLTSAWLLSTLLQDSCME